MRIISWTFACAMAFATGMPGIAIAREGVTSATTSFSDGFQGELERVAASHKGDMAIYCHHLETDEVLAVNENMPVETASTIKVAVMGAAMDALATGKGPFKDYYSTYAYDASTSTGGSGIIQKFKDGSKLELKELIHLMITVSDNIGTNMLVEWMGIEPVNNWLISHGFEQTRMFSTVGGSRVYDAAGLKEWGLGRTTAKEMATLLEKIATGKAGTTSTTDEMLRILGHQYFDGGIASQVPPMTYVGSKSGSLNRLRADAAIVASPGGIYILSIYTVHNQDTRWTNDNEGALGIQKISRMVWKHFNTKSDWEPADGADKF